MLPGPAAARQRPGRRTDLQHACARDPRRAAAAGAGSAERMKWIVAGLVAVIALAVGAWWYEEYRAESALLRLPVYQVLQKHHRPLFDELVAEYRVYQRDEERAEQYSNFASEKITQL